MFMNNRIKNNNSKKRAIKRERIIMLVSSAFVMAALTVTGFYMRNKSEEEQDDGYSVDFAKLENNVSDKYSELLEGLGTTEPVPELSGELAANPQTNLSLSDDELDYMPLEESLIGESSVTTVGSGQVKNPELESVNIPEVIEEDVPTVVTPTLSFTENNSLCKPVQGEILMHYNMDKTVYFQTLDQYKYNPAVIFKMVEGSPVVACADAQVVEIFSNEEIGAAIVLDLGNGYRATYGQLATYSVGVGDYVTANQMIATVGMPTKYYVTEGSNLYFSLEKDGVPVNPEALFAE